MAHEVKRSLRAKVGQAVHGYADGHRQLAVSTSLKPKDAKAVLALSDISGPGARITDVGYLTGYPLIESGVYALARTWAAPEMSRPGCVWTHTLFVELAELAQMEDLHGLLALFRRPKSVSDARSAYNISIDFKDSAPSWKRSDDEVNWVRCVVAGLYDKPSARIVSSRPDGVDVDGAILAVWSQQWPRLRRHFRFCTFAASDRSTDGIAFDLQLLSETGHGVRARFAKVVEVGGKTTGAARWLDDAVEDLSHPDKFGLRTFLRRAGADVAMGREAFSPLCRLHTAVQAVQNESEALWRAVEIVRRELSPRHARTASALVAKAALDNLENLNAEALEFLLGNLGLLDEKDVLAKAERLGRIAWRHDPTTLLDVRNDDRLADVRRCTLEMLGADEIVEGIARAPDFLDAVLAARPDVTGERTFWLLDPRPASDILDRPGVSPATAYALIAADRRDLAADAVSHLGANAILDAVTKRWTADHGTPNLTQWIVEAAKDYSAIAKLLVSCRLPRSMLVALASSTSPDSVPNNFGTDPWLIALNNATGPDIAQKDNIIFYSYLVSRSLGRSSQNPAELAKIGFDAVYLAASYSNMPEEAWRLLDQRLPWSVLWYWWDKCQRLRSGIVDLFVDRDLSPEIFATLSKDANLQHKLLDATTDKGGRGRDYYKRVKRAMKNLA